MYEVQVLALFLSSLPLHRLHISLASLHSRSALAFTTPPSAHMHPVHCSHLCPSPSILKLDPHAYLSSLSSNPDCRTVLSPICKHKSDSRSEQQVSSEHKVSTGGGEMHFHHVLEEKKGHGCEWDLIVRL